MIPPKESRSLAVLFLILSLSGLTSTSRAGDISQATNWFLRTSPVTNTLWGVAYGNDRFVGVGERGTVIVSDAGGVWEQRATGFGGDLQCVRFVNGLFMAGTTNGLLVSTNADEWTYRRIATPGLVAVGGVPIFTDIAYDGGQYVTVAKTDNSSSEGTNMIVLTSADGIGWIQRYGANQGFRHGNIYPGDPRFKTGLAFGNGRCVAAGWTAAFTTPGEQRFVTSMDLVNWAASGPSYALLPGSLYQFHTVSYSDGQFMAAGWVLGAYFVSWIFTSTDGFNWTPRITPTNGGAFTVLNETAAGAGWLVAAGDTVRVSTNGIQWAGPTDNYLWGASPLYAITYGRGTFVGVGYRGTIRQSDVVQDTPPFFVVAPTNQVVERGTTAVLRSQAAGSGFLEYQWFKDGSLLSGATSQVLTLSNSQPADAGTYTVTVTSPFGSITSLPVTLAVSFVKIRNYAGLTIEGIPGRSYRVEYLNQFQSSWQVLTNFVLPVTPYIWIDYETPVVPKRFYRTAELP